MISASNAFRVQDQRDRMILGMTKDAAKIREKARVARRKGLRQVEYRGTRYRRFQGRRGEVLEEEVRAEVRARRRRSIQKMAQWLEQQELANAEEGTPRELVVEVQGLRGGAEIQTVAVEPAGHGSPVSVCGEGGAQESLVEPGQRLLSEFFRSRK
jgi:hypothetical protein